MKAKRQTGVLYFRNLSKTLCDLYKTACYRRGKSMTQDLREHMLEAVKNDDPQAAKGFK